jgi:hypothetical protein
VQDLELRQQVAISVEWSDPEYLPRYELSFDAINLEFDRKGWNFKLTKFTHDILTVYSACSNQIEVKNQPTAAIALCRLFLALHEWEEKSSKSSSKRLKRELP